ncbi:MAG TPA: SGNH/GDSL hydrolase family protein [Armatimonadota bacterium]|jgi:lysophospholipase L1-like esterase
MQVTQKKSAWFAYILTCCMLGALVLIPPACAADNLGRSFTKLRTQHELTVGFIGGSITSGAGASKASTCYRALICRWLRAQYPTAKFNFINAAIGGTPSNLGAYRATHDLAGADLVFVEFAVNDDSRTDADILSTGEGLIRHLYAMNPKIDLVVLATIDVKMYGFPYTDSKKPAAVADWMQLAAHYTLDGVNSVPFIDVGYEVWKLAAPTAAWSTYINWDGYHPVDAGHAVYAKTVTAVLSEHANDQALPAFTKLPAPLSPNPPLHGAIVDSSQLTLGKAWSYGTSWTPLIYGKSSVSNTAGAQIDYTFSNSPQVGIYYDCPRVEHNGITTGTFDLWLDAGPKVHIYNGPNAGGKNVTNTTFDITLAGKTFTVYSGGGVNPNPENYEWGYFFRLLDVPQDGKAHTLHLQLTAGTLGVFGLLNNSATVPAPLPLAVMKGVYPACWSDYSKDLTEFNDCFATDGVAIVLRKSSDALVFNNVDGGKKAATARLQVHYCWLAPVKINVLVNGNRIGDGPVSLPATNKCEAYFGSDALAFGKCDPRDVAHVYQDYTMAIPLQSGVNTIKISPDSDNDTIVIDRITVTSAQ